MDTPVFSSSPSRSDARSLTISKKIFPVSSPQNFFPVVCLGDIPLITTTPTMTKPVGVTTTKTKSFSFYAYRLYATGQLQALPATRNPLGPTGFSGAEYNRFHKKLSGTAPPAPLRAFHVLYSRHAVLFVGYDNYYIIEPLEPSAPRHTPPAFDYTQ